MLRFYPPADAGHPGPQLDEIKGETAGRSMQVVVFSSQKGGSGKTTLCGQLAVQAELSGAGPVAIIDTDPQGSLAGWWNARKAETPVFMKAQVDYLHEDLDQLERTGIRLVFIDTPPAVTDVIRKIVGFADLVVVPTRPSPHDLRAVGATLDIIESQQKPLVFTINAASPRARITGDTAVALSQHGTVAPINLCHRLVYATSMIHGQSVTEIDANSQASREIVQLWEYLYSRLDKPECSITRGTGVFQQPSAAGFGRRKAPRPVAVAG